MNKLDNNNLLRSKQPSTQNIRHLKETKSQDACCFGSELTLKPQPAKDQVSFAGPLTGSR